jgi:heat shock protein HslJ
MRTTAVRLFWASTIVACTLGCRGGNPQPAGSGETPQPGPGAGGKLSGREWSLTSLGGAPAEAGNGGQPATLTFSDAENKVSGFAGCNRVAGTYDAKGDSLRIGPLALTRMACPSGMELETKFGAALDATRGYRITGNRLDLIGETGVVASLEAK